ncbi:uncharacterized protein LOC111702724 [Eurytemora carolleeae]|uniref:uncharacterized protein LOC111702724 n=1 Tax=Eurytemora carolleeae TaxID=1294199 RepID=UPI000C75DB45|nr:uncharacterized protein LOC111702724 [Eurytemora carolleeae]|eukprot:XP_023330266.1 uncharacterized protein LOC111702724 [Eurytemora affinis]
MGSCFSSSDKVSSFSPAPSSSRRTYSKQSLKSDTIVQNLDTLEEVEEVGGGAKSSKSANPGLRFHMMKKKAEIKENQTKLTTSLTNPIVDGGVEKRVLEEDSWFRKERDNLNRKFNTLPPIEAGRVVRETGTAFYID